MVEEIALGLCNFLDDRGYLHLGIGAGFAGDFGGFARGIASEHRKVCGWQ
jgi:hypothetical protein